MHRSTYPLADKKNKKILHFSKDYKMTNSVITAVDTLNHAFQEFKSYHHEEVQNLKNKTAQVTDLNEKMLTTTDRLSRLEVALKRPGQDSSSTYQSSDPAFSDFLRKGIDTGFLTQKSLTSAEDNSGSYLMSQPTTKLVNKKLGDLSIIRQLARVTTISTDSLDVVVEGKNAVIGWVAENEDRLETGAPEVIKIKIPVHQIYAKPLVSQKLLDDAFVNIEEWLARRLSEGMSVMENKAFISGDGVGKPKGILAYNKCAPGEGDGETIETFPANGEGNIEPDTLIDVIHSLKPEYLREASWLMSRSAAAAIRKLKDEQGAYLWQQSLSSNNPNTLLGYPVFLCDDMPDYKMEAKSLPVIFGNFKEAYQIVDRAQIHILRDPYSSKPYVEFYATKRVGGAVINFQALRILETGKAD